MTTVYLVQMEGPEWTETLGVFTGTVNGVLPQARAANLRAALEARDAVALRRVPSTYRSDTFLSLSRFVTVGRLAE